MGMPCNTWHFACITWVLKGLHGSILPGHVLHDTVFHAPLVRSENINCSNNTRAILHVINLCMAFHVMHQITMYYMAASHVLHGIPMHYMATEKCCCESKGLPARDCGQWVLHLQQLEYRSWTRGEHPTWTGWNLVGSVKWKWKIRNGGTCKEWN